MRLKNTFLFRFLFIAIFSLATFTTAFAQKGEIRGTVLNDATGAPMSFVYVAAMQSGLVKGGAYTTDDGSFVIKPLDGGDYELHVKNTGYAEYIMNNLDVPSDGARVISTPIRMQKKTKELNEIKIRAEKPLIEVGNPTNGKSMTADEIKKAPVRDVNSLLATGTAGVYQKDGGGLQINGDRGDGVRTIVDGVVLRSGASLPVSAIASAEIITGGVPAKYSDLIGGVINVTTKGASKQFNGGGELATSKFLDPYGYYLGAIDVTGPLLFRKEPGAKNKKPLLGYNLSVEFQHDKDPSPSTVGMYKVNDAKLAAIEQSPLLINPKTGKGYIRSAEFVNANDLQKIDYKQNTAENQIRVATRFDFNLNSNVSLSFGGNGFYTKYNNYVREYALFNSKNNPQSINSSWRVFGRFTQRLGKSDSASLRKMQQSSVQNAFYSIQVDYSQDNNLTWSNFYQKDPFSYGYLGKFETKRVKQFQYGQDSLSKLYAILQTFDKDTLVQYTPGTINPLMTQYATQYFNEQGDNSSNSYNKNLSSIQAAGGYINGQRPGDVNGLYYNTGRAYGGYNYSQNNQLRISIDGTFDLKLSNKKGAKPHSIEFGLLYEQRTDRAYNVSALGLWNLMRLLQNNQISELDKQNPHYKTVNGVFQDTIYYDLKYVAADQSNFDRNVRQKLGWASNSTQKLDIDALDPSFFSLNMFSADELMNNGNSYVGYHGYDYIGNSISAKTNYYDYFTKYTKVYHDGTYNKVYDRTVGANRPIYSAAYIQDRFNFNDLVFNVGLRIDRFDANTQVLKDPYSLYSIRHVGDVSGVLNKDNGGVHPSNIGSDYAVYVDQATNPATSKILGYRNGDTWYDSKGVILTDPTVLAANSSTNNIIPFLEDAKTKITDSTFDPYKSFTNFTPQLNFSPRIAFSFPINGDEALFFAHYDVMLQRPQGNNFITPDYYLYMDKIATDATFPNPALQPERIIDYQIGYKQSLSKKSALEFSAIYREYQDLIQLTRLYFTYPVDYKTYGNKDFSTYKAFEGTYKQRTTKNISITASYTLGFADGSGSSSSSQAALISAGVPNLRTIMPLNYDVRHTVSGSFDFHFSGGQAYNGPSAKWARKALEYAGVNLIFRARSGEPYTREGNARGIALITETGFKQLVGTINGSRLPWNYKFDLKIDKSFTVKSSKSKKGILAKGVFMNAYVSITNLLNTQNILSVYSYTGNPNDDGYLGSPSNASAIKNQNNTQGFIDQYKVKVDNPDNYSLPRRIRFGLQFNF